MDDELLYTQAKTSGRKDIPVSSIFVFYLGAKKAFDVAISNVFGLCPSQISLLYFLHYCNAGGSFEKLLADENGGAQSLKVKVYNYMKMVHVLR